MGGLQILVKSVMSYLVVYFFFFFKTRTSIISSNNHLKRSFFYGGDGISKIRGKLKFYLFGKRVWGFLEHVRF